MGMMKKASNKIAFAKIGLYGEAGSGKTRTAAEIAVGLHKYAKLNKPVGMFDTEPAASYIIPLFEKEGIEFLVYDESRALKDLMAFMREAEKECSIIIIDSITHVWRDAQDSYLKRMNEASKKRAEQQGWAHKWKPSYQLEFHHWKPIKAAWQTFTDIYLSSKVHCILCGRAGAIYSYQKNDETGKMELITDGSKMATEKELGYEPSLLIEMIKYRENGAIINRALIEKDRTDTLNGKVIDMPDFEKLKSHFEFLNIGGEHHGSMNTRDSSSMFDEQGNDTFSFERRQREIWCEEIQSILVKYYPSTKAEDKKAKADLIEEIFETGSWTKVSSMDSLKIKEGYFRIKEKLEPSELSKENGASDG